MRASVSVPSALRHPGGARTVRRSSLRSETAARAPTDPDSGIGPARVPRSGPATRPDVAARSVGVPVCETHRCETHRADTSRRDTSPRRAACFIKGVHVGAWRRGPFTHTFTCGRARSSCVESFTSSAGGCAADTPRTGADLARGQCATGSSAHRRFQERRAAGVFLELWRRGLTEYDALGGIDWSWLAADGAMIKAPLGGENHRAQSDGPRQAGHEAQRAHRGERRTHRPRRRWGEPI
jgi:hypothetical protein